MTQQKVFVQKVVYVVLMAVLLVPLYLLGRPAKTTWRDGATQLDTGGMLATIRADNHLADAQIGEVDPSSAALKLATFGLRGVAIAYLWYRANQFEKTHDWNNVVATGNQIVFLEPHFRTIWEFLGWKLSYNASADFDDYRERYRWVIRGFDFVVRGLTYNQLEPKLERWAGWTISQKIGIADENEQYRRLLRDDEPFGLRHGFTLPSERDNWLIGRHWYARGEKLIRQGILPGQETLFLYFSRARLNLVNYAVWIRKDGSRPSGEPIFGAVAVDAWKNAEREWTEYGQWELPTAVQNPETDTPFYTSLVREDEIIAKEKELTSELYALLPGFTEQLVLERWKALAEVPGQQASMLHVLTTEPIESNELRIVRDHLDSTEPDWRNRLQQQLDALYTQEQRDLKKIPRLFLEEGQRTVVGEGEGEIQQIRSLVQGQFIITPKIVAELLQDKRDLLTDAQRSRAREIVEEIESYTTDKRKSSIYRNVINYPARAREIVVEQTDEVDQAREFRHTGRRAYYSSDPVKANRDWLASLGKWDDLFNKPGFEDLRSDNTSAIMRRDLMELIKLYAFILDANRAIFPLDYTLQWLVRSELNNYGAITDNIAAQKFVEEMLLRDSIDVDNLDKVNEYAARLLAAWGGFNRSGDDYMRLSPLPEVRSAIIETLALYVTTLRKLQRPFSTELPCKSFVDEMMLHDEIVEAATEPTDRALGLVHDQKFADAAPHLKTAAECWIAILAKYPSIAVDPAQGYRRDVLGEIATAWQRTHQSLGDAATLPELPAPLTEFLRGVQ